MTVTTLNPGSRRRLRARAHKLKPVVIVGASGVTPALMDAVHQALEDHALIKVRINAEGRSERRARVEKICDLSGAELVQMVGHIAVLFRQPEDEKLREKFSKDIEPSVSRIRSRRREQSR